MTDYYAMVKTDRWTLDADTASPDPGGHWNLASGISATWQTETLPPTTQPSTISFYIYDDGLAPSGFIPLDQGDPISVTLIVDGYTLVAVQGRVSDVSGVAHPSGGVLFAVVVADVIADLAASAAPTKVAAAVGINTVYQALAAYLDVDIDPAGAPLAWTFREADYTGMNALDVLNRYIAHDLRTVSYVPRYLVADIDPADPDPIANTVEYTLEPYDPAAISELAGALEFVYSSGKWRLADDPDYYADGGVGMVLDASQVARDQTEWRKTRDQAVNSVELNGLFGTESMQTVRVEHADLRKLYGRNSRSMDSPLEFVAEARIVAAGLLGPREQVLLDYGLSGCTVPWETLTSDQRDAWAQELWPYDGSQAMGRPVCIVGIPDDWRPVVSPAAVGRIMGVTVTAVPQPAPLVRLGLNIRSVAPGVAGSITVNQVGSLGPPTVTPNNVDPAIRVVDLNLVGA